MRTFTSVRDLRPYLQSLHEDDTVVGLIPTMGAFHDGHVALMKRARNECDAVVVSLFVNPTQFSAGEDYTNYPRDYAADCGIAQTAGVDALFAPDAGEMYATGASTTVHVAGITDLWEGAIRPRHFEGVATICTKLFSIVKPRYAYFGRKDYQQLRVVERLATDLMIGVTVVPVPTAREPDGLAMSSRNRYLNADQRASACALFAALSSIDQMFKDGTRDAHKLAAELRSVAESWHGVAVEYSAIVDPVTMSVVPIAVAGSVAIIAARIGAIRLIDNMTL